MSVKIKYNAIFKWVLFILISASSFGLLAQSKGTVKKMIRSDFQQYFDQCQVSGAIAVYDHKRDTWILSDTTNTRSLTLPASTFKIINMLIEQRPSKMSIALSNGQDRLIPQNMAIAPIFIKILL